MTHEDEQSGTRRTEATEATEVNIERTRAAIQQDIKAIGEKFSAEEIKQQAKGVLADAKAEGATMIRETKDKAIDVVRSAGDSVRRTAHDAAHEIGMRSRQVGDMTADYARRGGRYALRAGEATGDFVADNAIPLSLIGLGVGWLALSLRRQRAIERGGEFSYRGYEYAGYEEDYPGADDFSVSEGQIRPRSRTHQLAGEARDRVGAVAHSAREQVEGAAHSARERVEGAAHEVADSARDLAQRARERVGSVADTAREQVSALAQRAGHGVDVARTRVTETASHLSDQAAALRHEARERMQRAQLRTRDFADENPLAVGAIAVAAGVGIGLLLPATQPENRLMGQTRDRLVGDARDLLREVRDTGGRVGETARDAAREVRSAATERVAH